MCPVSEPVRTSLANLVLALIFLAAAGTLVAGIHALMIDRPVQTAPLNWDIGENYADCNGIEDTCLGQLQPRWGERAGPYCREIAYYCHLSIDEMRRATDKEAVRAEWDNYIFRMNRMYLLNL